MALYAPVASAGLRDPYQPIGATTFDSPFSAVLLAVWVVPHRPPMVRAALVHKFCGYGLVCCRASAYALGFCQIAAVKRRSERREGACSSPMLTLEDKTSSHHSRRLTTRSMERRAPKGADGAPARQSGAHGQRPGG